jgi:hypothetical protein
MDSSGYCNRCGRPWNTDANCWCLECHPLIVRQLRRREGPGMTYAPVVYLSVLLHVGFVWLTETPEQLARLRTKERTPGKRVARSKVFSTARKPVPVDRAAGMGMGSGEVSP